MLAMSLESLIGGVSTSQVPDATDSANGGEVSIRIIGVSEGDSDRLESGGVGGDGGRNCGGGGGEVGVSSDSVGALEGQEELRSERGVADRVSSQFSSPTADAEAADVSGASHRDAAYQRYDIQQAARWIEQVLPFSLLLLVVFIRQHLRDTLVCQASMTVKCIILMYYKNSRGRNYCRQGQMLTLVEYLVLLYRAVLPAPVWYRFFLNKEYGSFFSSLLTGLYLTFKLTSVVEKVQSFVTTIKALYCKEVHYGAYATLEQVTAAGDMCAICQEKMLAPILLCFKHIFCEDCVSEWFERERTCPLCRALVKPADLKSYGDGSTSLFFQIF